MNNNFQLKANKNQKSIRLDKFILSNFDKETRNKIKYYINLGYILVNKKVVKPSYIIKPLDDVNIFIPKKVEKQKNFVYENITLNILYEDDYLLVINKPPGIVVHPGNGNYSGTLVDALSFYFQKKTNYNDIPRMGLVHRIDKNTSGLLLVAKDSYSFKYLKQQFSNRSIKRNYIALVWGDFEDPGKINGHIGRNLRNRKCMQVFLDGTRGKPAVTFYKVLERFVFLTLVSCNLKTGRTHQIRVHFKNVEHPIFNDIIYGGNKIFLKKNLPKYSKFIINCFSLLKDVHVLHAKSLGFIHPFDNKFIFFEASLPSKIDLILNKLRKYTYYYKL